MEKKYQEKLQLKHKKVVQVKKILKNKVKPINIKQNILDYQEKNLFHLQPKKHEIKSYKTKKYSYNKYAYEYLKQEKLNKFLKIQQNKELAKAKYQARQSYGQAVKINHQPKIDKKKQLEIINIKKNAKLFQHHQHIKIQQINFKKKNFALTKDQMEQKKKHFQLYNTYISPRKGKGKEKIQQDSPLSSSSSLKQQQQQKKKKKKKNDNSTTTTTFTSTKVTKKLSPSTYTYKEKALMQEKPHLITKNVRNLHDKAHILHQQMIDKEKKLQQNKHNDDDIHEVNDQYVQVIKAKLDLLEAISPKQIK